MIIQEQLEKNNLILAPKVETAKESPPSESEPELQAEVEPETEPDHELEAVEEVVEVANSAQLEPILQAEPEAEPEPKAETAEEVVDDVLPSEALFELDNPVSEQPLDPTISTLPIEQESIPDDPVNEPSPSISPESEPSSESQDAPLTSTLSDISESQAPWESEALFVDNSSAEPLLGPSEQIEDLDFLSSSDPSLLVESELSQSSALSDPEEKMRAWEELLNQRFSETAPQPTPQVEVFEKLQNFEIILNERFSEVAQAPVATSVSDPPILDDESEPSPPEEQESSNSPAQSLPRPAVPVPLKADTVPPVVKPVGGALRELEEVLTQTPSPVLPRGFKERALPAITLLSKLSGVERALVMVEDSSGELRCVARAGVDGEDYLSAVPLHLMKSVLRIKEPLLMLDTARDPRFSNDRRTKELGVASGICVPYSDCVSGGRGVLYADNLTKTNVFTHSDFKRVREFCERLARDHDLGEFAVVERAVKAAPPTLHIDPPVSIHPKWLVLTVCAAVMLAWPSLSKSPEKDDKPKPAKVEATRQVTDPKVVSLSFLRALETKNFSSAYNYLSPELQQTVDLEQFSLECQEFVSTGRNAWLLSGLSLIEGSLRNPNQRSFTTLDSQGETLNWQLTLLRSEDSWYIASIQGMPGISLGKSS